MTPDSTNVSSSPPASEERLLRIPLAKLHAHPANPNVMSDERRATLRRHIASAGRYPPPVVRPHPTLVGEYQLLDGHNRCAALSSLGYQDAWCYVWPCDDAQALLLLATLNRLEGEDLPARRASLLAELAELLPQDALASLLPESPDELEAALAWSRLDGEQLLADLEAAASRSSLAGPRLISFAVEPEDEALIEAALGEASRTLTGRNRRGRALALICAAYGGRAND